MLFTNPSVFMLIGWRKGKQKKKKRSRKGKQFWNAVGSNALHKCESPVKEISCEYKLLSGWNGS